MKAGNDELHLIINSRKMKGRLRAVIILQNLFLKYYDQGRYAKKPQKA